MAIRQRRRSKRAGSGAGWRLASVSSFTPDPSSSYISAPLPRAAEYNEARTQGHPFCVVHRECQRLCTCSRIRRLVVPRPPYVVRSSCGLPPAPGAPPVRPRPRRPSPHRRAICASIDMAGAFGARPRASRARRACPRRRSNGATCTRHAAPTSRRVGFRFRSGKRRPASARRGQPDTTSLLTWLAPSVDRRRRARGVLSARARWLPARRRGPPSPLPCLGNVCRVTAAASAARSQHL